MLFELFSCSYNFSCSTLDVVECENIQSTSIGNFDIASAILYVYLGLFLTSDLTNHPFTIYLHQARGNFCVIIMGQVLICFFSSSVVFIVKDILYGLCIGPSAYILFSEKEIN